MRKKIITGMMLATMIFALTGCNSSKTSNVSVDNTEEVQAIEETTIEESTTEEIAEEEITEEEITEENTYTVTNEDLCEKMEGLVSKIVRARVEADIAFTNVEFVERRVGGFEKYFVSDYDMQELKGCTQLGSVISGSGDKLRVGASVVKSNFDNDGFTYYKDSDAELNVTFNLTVGMWKEHDSGSEFRYNGEFSAIYVLENGSWKVRYFNITSLELDFTHISDENQKSVDELVEADTEEWKKAYIEYFNEPDNCNFVSFDLVDLNEDGIPEVCIDYQIAEGQTLIYLCGGRVAKLIDDCGYATYGKDYLRLDRGAIEYGSNIVYKYDREAKEYIKVFPGSYTADAYGENKKYYIDRVGRSEEEYNTALNDSIQDSNVVDVDTSRYSVDDIIQLISNY